MSKDAWSKVRRERNRKLKVALAILERHRTQKDYNLRTTISDDQAKKWADYAQDLRDVTMLTSVDEFVWPEEPCR